jgi:hypothetical protein
MNKEHDQLNPHPCRYCGKKPKIDSHYPGYKWICECGNQSPQIGPHG